MLKMNQINRGPLASQKVLNFDSNFDNISLKCKANTRKSKIETFEDLLKNNRQQIEQRLLRFN